MSEPTGAELIAAERQRQIAVEGWTADHDARHIRGELAEAALYYLDESAGLLDWPWFPDELPKRTTRMRDLVKAGALIAAEIDRLAAVAGHPATSGRAADTGQEAS